MRLLFVAAALLRQGRRVGALASELALEAALIDLQVRAGELTSYKTSTLARSPWEIGPLGDGVEPDNWFIGFYRIIGSPLPPRHNESQLWDNVRYLCDAEPPLKRAKKIFVLNRLDPKLEAEVRAYLQSRGFETITLPFDVEEYRPFQMEDSYGLAKEAWNPYLTDKFSRMNARLYVMNNNGARNFALRHGLKRGWAWTLPFDGNCIFETETWLKFLAELDDAKRKGMAYVAIPLVRTVVDNFTLVRNGAAGEHQVAFNRNAKVQFDPTQPYGHRPKVNLLWRLGVPGVWDNWVRDAPFRAQEPCELKNHRECGRTWPRKHPTEANRTWVSRNVIFRLPDGAAKPATGEDPDALGRRAELRDVGTMRKISDIDKLKPTVMVKPFRKPLYYNVMSMESMRRECLTTKMLFTADQQKKLMNVINSSPISVGAIHQHHCAQIEELVKLAETRLNDPPYSVVDKKKAKDYDPPEGATVHDYQRLGIYDWRIRELPLAVNVSDLKIPPALTEKGVVLTSKMFKDPAWRKEHSSAFVSWDGHAREGADIGAPKSDQFDRTRSYDMLSNVTMQALAYFYTGRDEFAEKAARIARVWFVNETTAQSPNMNYAQFSKRPEKAHFGVIATKDLAYALDALWLVTPTKFWSQKDEEGLQKWCAAYMAWLDQSNERKSPNNHGWYYLTQYLAVAKCAGKQPAFLNAKVRNHVEKYTAPTYIAPKTGMFVLEAERSRAVHYHFYSFYAIILAWRALSNLGARELMDQIRDAVRPTLVSLDAVLSNATEATCLSYDDEFKVATTILDDMTSSSASSSSSSSFSGKSSHSMTKGHRHLASEVRQKSSDDDAAANRSLAESSEVEAPRIRGCVPHAVALEYAAPVCQWAFDDDHAFAETLSMCRRQQDKDASAFPVLGTSVLEDFIVPPFMPTYLHMGYFPFTNLMW